MDGQPAFTWEQVTVAGENDFEAPVFAAHGELKNIKQSLLSHGAALALLSGSGATVFGLFADHPTAQQAAAQFAKYQNLKVFVVPTGSGALVLR